MKAFTTIIIALLLALCLSALFSLEVKRLLKLNADITKQQQVLPIAHQATAHTIPPAATPIPAATIQPALTLAHLTTAHTIHPEATLTPAAIIQLQLLANLQPGEPKFQSANDSLAEKSILLDFNCLFSIDTQQFFCCFSFLIDFIQSRRLCQSNISKVKEKTKAF